MNRAQSPSSPSFPWPKTTLQSLLNIEHPIVQAGMVWVSGAKLAAASANAGCLGIIGAGSMKPDLLKTQIQKTKRLTTNPFGINLPLLYEGAEEQMKVALDEGVKIFITSAGSPKKWTPFLKSQGAIVIHVCSNVDLGLKCEQAGVDAIVLEGFEAGGHNGRDELTTLVLLQQAFQKFKVPIIAAGGIGSGHAIAAAFALGADGVQIGTLFAAAEESSAHENFKKAMCHAPDNATFLRMKKLVPVRLFENSFAKKVESLENNNASPDELKQLLGKGRAMKGMLLGDLEEGELETGQIVSKIKDILPMKKIVEDLLAEFRASRQTFL